MICISIYRYNYQDSYSQISQFNDLSITDL